MQAIETNYKGYRFRSRLEARWAVFLDAIGVEWEYEPQGYEFDSGERYLPDFWISTWDCWIEVKGPEPTDQDARLAYLLAQGSGKPVILAHGQFKVSRCEWMQRYELSPSCYVFWGDTQQAFNYLFGYHEKYKPHPVHVYRVVKLVNEMLSLCGHLRGNGYDVKYTHDSQTVERILTLDKKYWADTRNGADHPRWDHGWVLPSTFSSYDGGVPIRRVHLSTEYTSVELGSIHSTCQDPRTDLLNAYRAAQTARFEHGETPSF